MASNRNGADQKKFKPHVCVIGAGVCGIVSVKICLESGLRVSCYEKSANYGGLWHYRPDEPSSSAPFEPSVMRTTVLNTSKELSSFSDFPPPAKAANYMRHNYYMDYIRSYVEHFKLLPHIKLQHEILECRPEWESSAGGGGGGGGGGGVVIKWSLKVKNLKTNEVSVQKFDRLMVAVGHHNMPYEPTYPGQHEFKGEIIHSARLKDILSNQKFVDKKVLVVGLGNSACDAASDISLVAKKCYVSCHRGQWFTSRYLSDGPYDFHVKTRLYHYASKCLPTSWFDRSSIKLLERHVNHQMLGLKPKHAPSEQVPAINDLFPNRIYTGGIVLKSTIKTFTQTGAIFEGEEEETYPIDVVVLATGYESRICFLEEQQLGLRAPERNNDYDLFLNVFAPNLKPPPLPLPQPCANSSSKGSPLTQNADSQNNDRPTTTNELSASLQARRDAIKSLAFIGLVQPNGSMTVIAELQARYAALIFKGERELPSTREMLREMRKRRKIQSLSIRSHSRDQLIGNYVAYMERVARLIGVRPNLSKLFFTDHKLWKQLMFGPCVPYQYRLSGPGYWTEARQVTLATEERVYCGINEGKNHILYKSRKRCLRDENKSTAK